MPVKLGLNGFGRIGRYLLRLLADDQDLQIVAINARADNAALAYLFKYDSTYGNLRARWTMMKTALSSMAVTSPLPAASPANGNGSALA